MENKKRIDEKKMYEYTELLKVIKATLHGKNLAKVCLNNHTLKTMAGYTSESTQDNFNIYVKKYLDKLSYDEHNKKVRKAKENNDVETLKQLSNEIMNMAGYVKDGSYALSGNINTYAKSFVDRKLLDRQLSKLYKALESGKKNEVDSVYKVIYSMTEYSNNRPYDIINEYAQTFVDNSMDEFIKRGIHTSNCIEDNRRYAV